MLVIGSQTPWVEGLCLAAGARHVFTLEYGKLATDHPDVTVLTPEEFLARGRAGTLKIDVVVTASSLEHAGLGRGMAMGSTRGATSSRLRARGASARRTRGS